MGWLKGAYFLKNYEKLKTQFFKVNPFPTKKGHFCRNWVDSRGLIFFKFHEKLKTQFFKVNPFPTNKCHFCRNWVGSRGLFELSWKTQDTAFPLTDFSHFPANFLVFFHCTDLRNIPTNFRPFLIVPLMAAVVSHFSLWKEVPSVTFCASFWV